MTGTTCVVVNNTHQPLFSRIFSEIQPPPSCSAARAPVNIVFSCAI